MMLCRAVDGRRLLDCNRKNIEEFTVYIAITWATLLRHKKRSRRAGHAVYIIIDERIDVPRSLTE